MSWVGIVIIAHTLNALSFLVSKFLLEHVRIKPIGYAAIVGFASLLVTVLVPFGYAPLSAGDTVIALVTGAAFTWALLYFFRALDSDEVSTIVPVIGGAIPIITFVLAWFLLGERLPQRGIEGFILLVLGTIFMLWVPQQAKKVKRKKEMMIALFAAFLFAASFVGTKYIFEQTTFVNGFTWTRWGSGIAALLFLLNPKFRKEIVSAFKLLWSKTGLVFGGSQLFGGVAFVLISYAITLASPTLINALQGVQYGILLVLALLAWVIRPNLLKEQFTRKEIVLKIFGVIIISAGVLLVATL
ncbi:MAG: EamA family transporter [Candidatus Jacksonbacteria bacterium]|jgi:drug/metabolite transporter (DMT)-like permease|nr:EamA family transporter [Candidatus Jacksonbacteria bacterium]MBT6034448.1 EamA family transporter [Candidatus Jacksonbacteria bacterium]MBT6301148.1 EamA family transporter [Candidatus Jacksonbacteria bacterium]MBT6757742.1 EamA family transporter [Candidatus Jacksonbacteria bacterium]MBT6955393.1 EamA family transporter [Candidatus Jacksonbacteria bacterium]